MQLAQFSGGRSVRLMIEHNLGVNVKSSYEVKQVDSDYFTEE